jgi:hypothetical protein
VDLEEKYAIALGVLSIVLWGGSFILAKALADAPSRVIRTVLPIIGVLTLTVFGTFVIIARAHVKG